MEIWYQRPISRDGVVDTNQDFPEIFLIKTITVKKHQPHIWCAEKILIKKSGLGSFTYPN